jgi:pimeloyl-ACP methyl ester carboxylesterase
VLIPGFAGLAWDTGPFEAWHHRILVTGKLPDAGTLEEYATAVESWTSGLAHYALVGDSFGALIALALAGRHPRRLSAGVLSGAFGSADLRSWLEPMASSEMEGDVDFRAALERNLRRLQRPGEKSGAADRTFALVGGGCDPAVFRRRASLALACDTAAELGRVSVPTLVIRGMTDRASVSWTKGDCCVVQTRALSGGLLARFATPGEYALAVERFLESLPAPNGHSPGGRLPSS